MRCPGCDPFECWGGGAGLVVPSTLLGTTLSASKGRTPLTREFGLPLYQQVHHLLRHRIVTGAYVPGSKIPSESELCRELAVSRVTVREALRELVQADMLVKVHGKGAFVAADTPRPGLAVCVDALDDCRFQGVNLAPHADMPAGAAGACR